MQAVRSLLLAVALAVAAPAAANAGLQHDTNAIVAAGSSGAVAELMTDSGVQRTRAGVAQLGTTTPVPLNAHFRIGSVTKSFVAVATLQQVAAGQLSLNDTVEEWLPGVVSGNGNDGSLITIRQLLQQTTGLADYFSLLPINEGEDAFFEHRFDVYTDDELVEMAMELPPSFPPGSAWEYSNTNYALLGMILEEVTGDHWFEVVHDGILAPLGLNDTSWPNTNPNIPAPSAHGYELFELGEPLVDVTQLIETPTADGGMVSTPADVNKFYKGLMSGQLLPGWLLNQMKQTVRATGLNQFWPRARYGLGLIRLPLSCGGYLWTHNGDTFGFMTRHGVTSTGSRRVTVSVSTQMTGDDDAYLEEDALARELVDDALCP